MLGHNCNPSAQEADAGGSRVPGKGRKEERRRNERMGKREGDRGILDLPGSWERRAPSLAQLASHKPFALERTKFFRASAFTLAKPGQGHLPLSYLGISR